MKTGHVVPSLRRRQVFLFYSIFWASLLVLFSLAAEIILRLKGEHPWNIEKINIVVEPGGKFFTKHPILGYANLPGKFKVVLPTSYSFNATHLDNTLRITHPLDTYNTENKDEIWIFGCSYTYGWSLNDDETYSWFLQERMPQYEIINFGVNGYGTAHSLVQFREALKTRPKPKFAIIGYAHFHNERNTFLRSRRKQIVPGNKLGPLVQPYALINDNGELTLAWDKIDYWEFPFMRHSAFIHSLEKQYNRFEGLLEYDYSRDVTRALIKEFANLARTKGIELVITGLLASTETRQMLRYATNEGIITIDMGVNFNIRENTNLPHDPHPSAAVNKKWGQELAFFLKKMGA
jgi:hypothetical protein